MKFLSIFVFDKKEMKGVSARQEGVALFPRIY